MTPTPTTDSAVSPVRELRPCPFCGGEAELRQNPMTGEMTMAHCQRCGASAFHIKWNWRAESEPAKPGSCASCNGTGDLGGNPSYGMCPDCDGTGKFPPAEPLASPPSPAEVTPEPERVPHEVALAGFYEAQKADVKAKPLYDQCVAIYKAMRAAALQLNKKG